MRHHDELMAKAREKLGVDLSEYKMLGIGARAHPSACIQRCRLCTLLLAPSSDVTSAPYKCLTEWRVRTQRTPTRALRPGKVPGIGCYYATFTVQLCRI